MSTDERDLCANCTLRGDIKSCADADCFVHESWYSKQLEESQIQEFEFSAQKQQDILGLFCWNLLQMGLDKKTVMAAYLEAVKDGPLTESSPPKEGE